MIDKKLLLIRNGFTPDYVDGMNPFIRDYYYYRIIEEIKQNYDKNENKNITVFKGSNLT